MTDLTDDTRLEIRLSATIARGLYTKEPTDVLDEVRAVAAGRGDLLAKIAGIWIGSQLDNPHAQPLADALRTIDGVDRWIPVGRARAGVRNPGRY